MAGPTAAMIAQRARERKEAEARARAASAQAGGRGGQPRRERLTGALSDAAPQLKAFGRGAGDALSFGFYDPIAAGLEATVQPGGLDHWQDRFRANRAEEEAQDRYEAAHYPVARTAGQVGGTLLSLAAGGPVSGGARIAGAARMTAREGAAWLGAHGALGAGLQTATDAMQGRPLSWRDDLGAAVGGMAGAAAGVRLPPGRAGAIGGAVSAAAEDLLHGRPVSLRAVADGALGGRLAGGVAGRAGRNWADGLSSAQKGKLGEELGAARNLVNGKPSGRLAAKTRDYLPEQPKKWWFPDRQVGEVRYEDKFGPAARLSQNQRLAQAQLGPLFQVNHFLPEDIGKLVGLPAASAATRPQSRLRR